MDFILRPWRREDAAAVAQYANNEKIARNLRDVFPYPYTLADAESFVDSCLGADGSCELAWEGAWPGGWMERMHTRKHCSLAA